MIDLSFYTNDRIGMLRRDDRCCVFVAQAEDGPVKIGTTQDPRGFLRKLRTGLPTSVGYRAILWLSNTHLAKRVCEKTRHDLHTIHRSGNWFDTTVELAETAIKNNALAMSSGEKAVPHMDMVAGLKRGT